MLAEQVMSNSKYLSADQKGVQEAIKREDTHRWLVRLD